MPHLEVPHVEGALDLVVPAAVLADDLHRRDAQDHAPRPSVGPLACGAPRRKGAPVVTDEDRVVTPAECLMEGKYVGDQRGHIDMVTL
jgi:hypothetical protein